MKLIIKTTLLFIVLATITIYSNFISEFIVDNYNNSIAFLSSNSVKTTNPLGF